MEVYMYLKAYFGKVYFRQDVLKMYFVRMYYKCTSSGCSGNVVGQDVVEMY